MTESQLDTQKPTARGHKSPVTALVFASGKGSRMKAVTDKYGVPKHLLPLYMGTNRTETTVGRLVSSLSTVADRVICIIESALDLASFEAELRPRFKDIEILVKDPTEVEFGEIGQVLQILTEGTLIVTNGDLLFDDGVLEGFIASNVGRPYVFRGREGNSDNKSSFFDIFNSRVSLIPIEVLKRAFQKSSTAKKKFAIVMELVVKTVILGRVSKIPTVANVDTPKDYETARQFFLEKE